MVRVLTALACLCASLLPAAALVGGAPPAVQSIARHVVLIGAGMPSVLAEISFLTNRQEAQLLKTPAYKDRIAEALHDAVMKYRRALKRQSALADRP